jgi:KDO2-lipid IV(A) lauroyltransferase
MLTALVAVCGRLPGPIAAWLGRRLGDLLFVVLRGRRQVALANLTRAFPDVSGAEREQLCRRFFRHLGLMLIELCSLLARPIAEAERQVRIEGLENLTAAVAAHGRAICVSAHLGNWELLALASRLTGFRLALVVRPLDSPVLDRLAARLREKTGVQLIDKRGAVGAVLAVVARGELVGILLDQNASRRESVFVPFFGIPASTSRSAAVLALRTRAPIVPVFIRRESWGCHRVAFLPALPAPKNAGHGAVVELTMKCTEAIEVAIRQAPEQWFWIHKRWKTGPAATQRG